MIIHLWSAMAVASMGTSVEIVLTEHDQHAQTRDGASRHQAHQSSNISRSKTKYNINKTLFYLHASINGEDVTILVDLGASHNFAPAQLV